MWGRHGTAAAEIAITGLHVGLNNRPPTTLSDSSR
jgi:hypothetical protein